MEHIWKILQEQFANNELFAGGAILMTAGALLAFVRNWPARILGWVKKQLTVVIDIPDKEPAFHWINKWLSLDTYSKKRARLLTVHTERDEDRNDPRPKILFSPAPGTHYLWYRKRFMILTRERENPESGGSGSSRDPFREYFTIRILGRDRSVSLKLLEEAREISLPKKDRKIQLHQSGGGYWSAAGLRTKRNLDSIILSEDKTNELIVDMERFLNSRDWYNERGIPYRRGYMFYGPPGNGKSSIVVGLASHFNFDLGLINLRASDFEDYDLLNVVSQVPTHTIILIEDIDCVVKERKLEDSGVTFSGLLNALDGVASAEGQIIVMTTNHIEKLDSALIRPGRCDVKVDFKNASKDQIVRMFDRFYPGNTVAEQFTSECPSDISMAQLQGHFLNFRDEPELAIENVNFVKENK